MSPDLVAWLAAAVFTVALLYSSVGHAGASGYIAAMALFGMAPATIKPVALSLNIAVAAIAAWQFRRAGHFSWRLFWPFAALSVPLAFFGATLAVPDPLLKALIGLALLCAAARFLWSPQEGRAAPPSRAVALATGGGIGLLSGVTGTGGGIFLTPLLLLMRWAHTRTASAVSAMFILVNSLAGLAGHVGTTHQLPAVALPLALAAIAGGALGSYLGSRRLPQHSIRRLLSAVLTIAGAKLIFAA